MARRRFGSIITDDRRSNDVHIVFRVGGERRKRKVASLADAEKTLAIIQGMALQRKSMEEVLYEVFGERPRSKMTFLELAALYLEYSEANRRPSTHRNNVYRLKNICRSRWSRRDLASITTAEIHQWSSRRLQAVKHATVNRDVSIISVVFKWAVRLGYVEDNPAGRIERGTEARRPRTLWLEAEECHALVEAADTEFRSVLVCALHAGLRRAELWDLEWRSVDLRRKELVVEPEHQKSPRPRRVPMTRDLVREFKAVRQRRKPDDLRPRSRVLLRPPGRPWGASSTRQALARTRRRATEIVEERRHQITMHVLRHTFASHLAQQGVAFQEIAQLLGHTTTRVTERYAHMAPGCGSHAVSRLERSLRLGFDADEVRDAGSALVALKPKSLLTPT